MSLTKVIVLRLTDAEIAAIIEALHAAKQAELARKVEAQASKGVRK